MQKIDFHSFYTFMDGPMAKPGSNGGASVMMIFSFGEDLSFLFPYINAVAKEAELYEKPDLIRFVFNDAYCVLYPEKCIASPLKDRESAKQLREKIIEFLNDILERKNEIVPKFKVFQPIPVTEIIKLLPGTNCKKCGYNTCLTFAAMLSKQKTHPGKCPHIGLPINEQVTYPVHDEKGRLVNSVTLNIDTFENKRKKELMDETKIQVKTKELSAANASLPSDLTRREMDVLSMMGLGLTNREISEQLKISPHTVKTHVINIFNKLGVNHRTQAVVWAVRHQLI